MVKNCYQNAICGDYASVVFFFDAVKFVCPNVYWELISTLQGMLCKLGQLSIHLIKILKTPESSNFLGTDTAQITYYERYDKNLTLTQTWQQLSQPGRDTVDNGKIV